MNDLDQQLQDREESNLAAMVGDLARRTTVSIGTAECLTEGRIATRLGRTREPHSWFVGGIVADSPQLKRGLLQVSATSLVSEQAAREMAVAARVLLHADLCLAVTGSAEPTGGRAAGTVCFAVADRGGVVCETRHLPGAPAEVAAAATAHALALVRRRLTAHWQRHRVAS